MIMLYFIRKRCSINSKLTLSIDKEVIDKAKYYAKIKHQSISNMIENYLKSLINEVEVEVESFKSPIVNEISGSVKNINQDINEEYTDYLINKYK